MYIKKELVKGCDSASRVYKSMFDVLLKVMLDSEKLKNLSPIDFSAIGMYIGKFVEQEINSSVVQIMREFMGIEMPRYYCKKCPGYVKSVQTQYKNISLNSPNKDSEDYYALQTTPLGDAYVALDILKAEDDRRFFDNYPWLYDDDFLDAWWKLSKFRNKMAHIGEIIDGLILKDNLEYFQTFLEYLPDMIEAKRQLAPVGYKKSLKTSSKKKAEKPYYTSILERSKSKEGIGFTLMDECASEKALSPKPQTIKFEQNKYSKLLEKERKRLLENQREKEFISNPNAKIFKQRKGKRGLKDSSGKIIVPPLYDNFGFLPKQNDDYKRKSVIAIRDEKYVLVALDGSGKELSNDTYDDIKLADKKKRNSPYVYRKNGRRLWGLMNEEGHEICECILDNYIGMNDFIWCDSGELRGCWFYTRPNLPFLPPIYDNIEVSGIIGEPMIFVLKGEYGYVKKDGTFIPMSEIESMPEDQRQNTLKECIVE